MGRMPWEDQSDAVASQGTPTMASTSPDTRGATQNRFSLSDLRWNQPCQHLDLRPPASRTMRTYMSVVKSLVCGTSLQQLHQIQTHRSTRFELWTDTAGLGKDTTLAIKEVALAVKSSLVNAGDIRYGFNPWLRKTPWRRAWIPSPVFWSGESHGQRNLAGYSPWDFQESTQLKRLSTHS